MIIHLVVVVAVPEVAERRAKKLLNDIVTRGNTWSQEIRFSHEQIKSTLVTHRSWTCGQFVGNKIGIKTQLPGLLIELEAPAAVVVGNFIPDAVDFAVCKPLPSWKPKIGNKATWQRLLIVKIQQPGELSGCKKLEQFCVIFRGRLKHQKILKIFLGKPVQVYIQVFGMF